MPTAALKPFIDDTDTETRAVRTLYEAPGLRKTVFAIVFLLLLPFYASLPAMIFQRVVAGVWMDTWGLLVIAAAFTVLMALVLFELIYALRAEIEVGDDAVSFVLPMGGPGAIPMLNYRSQTVAYDRICSVEKRTEVYGGMFAPVLMTSTWLRLDDGRPILLGAVNASCTDSVFPFDDIARQIADRADVEIRDRGVVRRPIKDAVYGIAAGGTECASLDEAAIGEVNQRHRTFVWALVSVFVFLFAMGVASDLLRGTTDLGERAPNTFHSLVGW